MEKLNEVKQALKYLEIDAKAYAENFSASMIVSTKNILAIAEAFRALEQEKEAAEAKLAGLAKQEPMGRVDRGAVSDSNEYPDARVVCLHEHVGWEAFQDGCELFIRPAPAVGMDKPEPYAWLVHAPQGDYVERNPEVVAHLEGTGLTKCKPLYLDL